MFDSSDDLQGATAPGALVGVDLEHPFTKALPGFRPSGRCSPVQNRSAVTNFTRWRNNSTMEWKMTTYGERARYVVRPAPRLRDRCRLRDAVQDGGEPLIRRHPEPRPR